MSAMHLERDTLGSFDAAAAREWLVTNGLGGFAAGTIAGANTRRYHGLLVASLRPPVERVVMVAKLEGFASYRGRRYALSANEYLDGTIDPHGYRHLASFRLEGLIPVWSWSLGDALLEARVWMAQGRNTTYVSYSLPRASAPLELELAPLCTYRDYHSHNRGRQQYGINAIAAGVEIVAFQGARPYRILAEDGECSIASDWFWNFRHRLESERGLDDGEDLCRPATFRVRLEPGATSALILDAETTPPRPTLEAYARERSRHDELLARAALPEDPAWIRQLALAADQFIVERRDAGGQALGETVIAGYPWFSDWGRDTMIALPGLTLATGRHASAASILRTFARFVSEGMLPNRFPDAGDAPEYNTVDATLWYFVAVEEYWRATRDRALLEDLYPVLVDIVDWHRRGTRYGIRVDENDGLLRAGEPGVQLTWMDAKVGDWVVTPRIGKPVEINALWFNALFAIRGFATELGHSEQSREFGALAERVGRSFNESFWYETGGYLYDVIDGPEGEPGPDGQRRDASLRPNQIFAVSLPHALLHNGRARSVVDVCARELWTPVGLRSLAPNDTRYVPVYQGGPWQRDGAYHQGTVWSWLLGPFALAHFRAFGDASAARNYLDGIAGHLREACIGQVSEILDADAPNAPRGCFAQAWSVAEILRAWRELDESENREPRSRPQRRRARQVAD